MDRLFKNNGQIIEVKPKNNKYYTLKELQDMIGGYIEHIHLNNKYSAIVDEEGKLKNLSTNVNASNEFYKLIGFEYSICGNVLICETKRIK